MVEHILMFTKVTNIILYAIFLVTSMVLYKKINRLIEDIKRFNQNNKEITS